MQVVVLPSRVAALLLSVAVALSLHQPNSKNERARFFELEDTRDSLRLHGGLVTGR